MSRIRHTALSLVAVCGLGLAFGALPAVAAPLPESDRLDPVRPALERTVEQAARDGLPADLIISKVREGLAKGVAPEAIRAAAERLARSLGDADQFLRAHRKKTASALLVRALAEARTSGIDLDVIAPMIQSDAQDGALVRAVEVLTDLALRGYPSRRAAFLVKEVLERDPGSVARVVAGVEAVRLGQTVSRVDALEALDRNIVSSGGSFDTALNRSLDAGDRGNSPARGGQGSDHQGGSGASKKGVGMGMDMMKMKIDSLSAAKK